MKACLITRTQSDPDARPQEIEFLTEHLVGHHQQGAELFTNVRQNPVIDTENVVDTAAARVVSYANLADKIFEHPQRVLTIILAQRTKYTGFRVEPYCNGKNHQAGEDTAYND